MTTPASRADDELTLDEIKKRHQKLWVAIVVTKRDKNGQPTAGRVVAEDADRYRLRDLIVAQDDVCIFFAGESPFPLFL